MKIPNPRRINLGIALALLAIAVICGVSYLTAMEFVRREVRIERARRILAEIPIIRGDLDRIVVARRGSGAGPQASDAIRTLSVHLRELEALTEADRPWPEDLAELAPLISRQRRAVDELLATAQDEDGRRDGTRRTGDAFTAREPLLDLVNRLEVGERKLLAERESARQGNAAWSGAVLTAGLIINLSILTLVFVRLRRYLRQQRGIELASRAAAVQQQAILDGASYAIILCNPDGVIRALNRAAERFFGRQADEIIGKLTPVVCHDPRELEARARELGAELGRIIAPGFEALVAKAGPGKADEYEWASFGCHTHRIPALISTHLLPETAPGSGGYLITISDLTERKRSESLLHETEDQYLRLFNSIVNPILIYDRTRLDLLAVNEAAVNHYGYTRAEFLSMSIRDLRPADDAAIPQENLAEDGLGQQHGVWRQAKKDGTIIDVEANSQDVEFDGHQVRLVIINDITERRKMEAAMQRAHDAALESARLKSEFLATMSHEIRTPMNGVIGMTSLLLDTELSAIQRDCAETIRNSAESLLTIINDILDVSRIEAGKLNIEEVDFDLRQTVEATVEGFTEAAARKGLKLASMIEDDVPTLLIGDPGRLHQVLTNLLGNAVKFTERGEVVLTVANEAEIGGEVVIRFTIRDTGIGMTAETLARLFTPFMQADGSMARKYGGAGLGLAIARQLVELMRGEIKVTSSPGEGSSFSFVVRLSKQGNQRP